MQLFHVVIIIWSKLKLFFVTWRTSTLSHPHTDSIAHGVSWKPHSLRHLATFEPWSQVVSPQIFINQENDALWTSWLNIHRLADGEDKFRVGGGQRSFLIIFMQIMCDFIATGANKIIAHKVPCIFLRQCLNHHASLGLYCIFSCSTRHIPITYSTDISL